MQQDIQSKNMFLVLQSDLQLEFYTDSQMTVRIPHANFLLFLDMSDTILRLEHPYTVSTH